MAIGIDVSKRKPRQTKGTPAYYSRNKFALIALGISSIFGLISFTSLGDKLMNRITRITHEPESYRERMEMMSIVPYLSSSAIAKQLKALEDIRRPDI